MLFLPKPIVTKAIKERKRRFRDLKDMCHSARMLGAELSLSSAEAIESRKWEIIGNVPMKDFYVYCYLTGISVHHRSRVLSPKELRTIPIVRRKGSWTPEQPKPARSA